MKDLIFNNRSENIISAGGYSLKNNFLKAILTGIKKDVITSANEYFKKIAINYSDDIPLLKEWCYYLWPQIEMCANMKYVNDLDIILLQRSYYRKLKEANYATEMFDLTQNYAIDLARLIMTNNTEQHYSSLINAICFYINNKVTEDLSLTTLSNKFSYSKTYLSHKFKTETGQSISAYILEKRLIKSTELLLAGMPVGEVASRLNFSSSSYFTKKFKQRFSIKPSELKDIKRLVTK